MEKVLIVERFHSLLRSDANEINEFLDQGWNTKSVQVAATKEYVTAVVVLEKPD